MREDIELLPNMRIAGWQPHYNDADIRHERTDKPHHDIQFRKGTKHLWKCKNGWQVADMIDGTFCNHIAGSGYGLKADRYIHGFIPDLKTVLELDAKDDL